MTKKIPRYLIKHSILSAIFYIIPVVIFIKNEKFSETWLLYLGNALFLFYVFIFVVYYGKQQNIKTSPIMAGLAITLIGIIFSCVLALAAIFIFAPGVFDIGTLNHALQNTPPTFSAKHSHGIIFILFANATIGNFTTGSVASLLSWAATKQTKTPGG
jgi:hypothetical protein